MNRINLKKLLILNIPYILVGLFATNLGEAWRLAEGADSSAKILSFFYVLPVALGNPLPSFYPLDLLVGIACGAGLSPFHSFPAGFPAENISDRIGME